MIPRHVLTNYECLTLIRFEIIKLLFFAYRCCNDVCPPVNRSLHGYETREADNFIVEYRDTTRAAFGIRYLAPAIWNDVPAGIREAEHIGLFKVNLKKTFIGSGEIILFFLFLLFFLIIVSLYLFIFWY